VILQKVHRTIPDQQSAIDENRLRFFTACPIQRGTPQGGSEAAKKYGVHRKITHLYGDSN